MARQKIKMPTQRDLDVMTILWNSEVSMKALDIAEASPDLNINTVQAVLRKLLKNGFIEVGDIVYSGTVLSRAYRPKISQNDFTTLMIAKECERLGEQVSKVSLIANLLKLEPDKERRKKDIIEVKEMIEQCQKNGEL